MNKAIPLYPTANTSSAKRITIRHIGFVYENRQNARIVCIDNQGKELFYVYKYDNGPDYIREGLFRIMDEDGWIGFADSLGNVVIKPQFKFATSFENGKSTSHNKRGRN